MTQTNRCSGGPTEPTSAERVVTLLAAADSLTVTTDEHRCELVGLHYLGAEGRVVLRAPAPSCWVTRILGAGGVVGVRIEITDVAAMATRDRVRARVTAHGWLSLDHDDRCSEPPGVLLEIQRADLQQRGAIRSLAAVEIAGAEVDPLAPREAELLLHLGGAHPEAIQTLTRLLDPAVLQAATRVIPLVLDRYGLVLRVERRRGHSDVRLPFGATADDSRAVSRALGRLLLIAERRPRLCRPWSAGASGPNDEAP